MKKLFLALLAIAFIVTPAMAVEQNWTINFELANPDAADHINIKYAAYSADFTAPQFMNRSDLQIIPNIPATSPQNFTVDFPVGTTYAIFGEIVNEGGDIDYFMREKDGILSPVVWRAPTVGEIGEAVYEDVTPVPVTGGGVINIITINNNGN
jgi:hypothetical protein